MMQKKPVFVPIKIYGHMHPEADDFRGCPRPHFAGMFRLTERDGASSPLRETPPDCSPPTEAGANVRENLPLCGLFFNNPSF